MMKKLSRREFLQGTAAGAASVAVAGIFGGAVNVCAEEAEDSTVSEYVVEGDHSILKLAIMDLAITYFNYKVAANPTGFKYQANFIDPLVLIDATNQVIPGLAESWEKNEDASVWTFHLREGAAWVDYQGNYMDEVIAEDFLWGLEWVLNYQKNAGTNSSVPVSMLVGAGDYYEYTKTLSEEEGLALGLDSFKEMISGVQAPDDYTLTFTLNQSCIYFDSVVTATAFWPIPHGLLETYGVESFATATYDTIWYCGPYRMSRFVEGNTEFYAKNESYWDVDNTVVFDEVQRIIVESTDIAYEMYQNGENDCVELTASYMSMLDAEGKGDYICRDASRSSCGFVIFNYNRKNTDDTLDETWNTVVANEAFRQCFYYGLDLTNWCALSDFQEPYSQFNCTITHPDLARFTDGTDYTDRVLELLGLEKNPTEYPHQDAELAASYKAQAMEELGAQGVEFPVPIEIWTSSNQDDQDEAVVLKQCIEDGLGTDFVTVNINTYVKSASQEYIYPGYYSITFDGSAATYNDPMGIFQFLLLDNEDGDFTNIYGDVPNCSSDEVIALWQELTDMIYAADAIIDQDERYEAFAQAEVFAINHALLIPTSSDRMKYLTRYITYGGPSRLSEYLDCRMTNLTYIAEGCTNADFEAARAAIYGEA